MYSKAINKHIRDKLSLENSKWDWHCLSKNKHITWEIVKNNITGPWDWCSFCTNKNITWDIVKKNIDRPWDWIGLSRNENVLLSLDEKMNIVRMHRAASVIQGVWRMVVSNPNYLVCKKRLLREYASLDVI